eukprot:6968326-Prymnesium_polylepis.1
MCYNANGAGGSGETAEPTAAAIAAAIANADDKAAAAIAAAACFLGMMPINGSQEMESTLHKLQMPPCVGARLDPTTSP